ncbi:peptidylprolyl isomerase [Mesonia sp. K7]|uniref:peptidylprolyl isomerase n=1 Tax=Mesonia sp. K7 TaxID=2218606 RepID=UPI001F2AC1A4|nr:peptidylprolyl isomerase [Mesonia sp. K7]
MKPTTKLFLLILIVHLSAFAKAQQDTLVNSSMLVKSDTLMAATTLVEKDTVKKPFKKFKADGVAAVVGEFVILDSDIIKMREDIKAQGMDTGEITDCQIVGRLMENKLYAHHAELDTLISITQSRVEDITQQQLDRMVAQVGDIDKVVAFYRKDSEKELRDELNAINRESQLSSMMQEKIVKDVEVTPEEVRQFFDKIPEDELPMFGDEVEISQLVIKPKVPKEEEQKVIDQLNQMRDDIVNNGASFATKAVLYSQDATSTRGGQMTISRKDPLDKDFKQVAFSLQEGEVSKPFKSEFGYHIVQLDKIKGQKLDIRHIIIIPKYTIETEEIAKNTIDTLRTNILNGKYTFDEVARKYSDEKETREDGGQLINPKTGDTRFELTDIDPTIYEQVNNLDEGEISLVLADQTRTGQKFFKIITVNKKHPEHLANYSQDYTKIKQLALREKQIKEVEKWQKKNILDTYVKVSEDYQDCKFTGNWLKTKS